MSFFSFIVFYCISTVLADEHDHTYQVINIMTWHDRSITWILCFRTMTRLYYGWTQLELIITETEDLCILHITILCWLEKLTREHITIFNIWTHKKFEIISEGRRKLQLGESIAFSYEVIWKKSDTKFEVWTAFFEAKLIKVDLFYRIDLTSTLTQTFSNIGSNGSLFSTVSWWWYCWWG